MKLIRLPKVSTRFHLIGLEVVAFAFVVVMIVTTGGSARNEVLASQTESSSRARPRNIRR